MSMEKMRDSIDFKNTDIKTLFRKLLLPTVLGMIFSALFVITDGIFVGKGYHGRCIDDSILSDAPPVRTALPPH